MVREPGYTVEAQWHSQPRKIRLICVGAGAAGLLLAYKLKRSFEDYDLVCYEKCVVASVGAECMLMIAETLPSEALGLRIDILVQRAIFQHTHTHIRSNQIRTGQLSTRMLLRSDNTSRLSQTSMSCNNSSSSIPAFNPRYGLKRKAIVSINGR